MSPDQLGGYFNLAYTLSMGVSEVLEMSEVEYKLWAAWVSKNAEKNSPRNHGG